MEYINKRLCLYSNNWIILNTIDVPYKKRYTMDP